MKVLFTLVMEKKEGHYVEIEKEDVWLQDLMKKYAGAKRPDVKVLPSDYALILFSGGTTGTPKGVIGSHHSQVMTGMQFDAYFKAAASPYKDVISMVLPLFHSFGTYAVMSTCLLYTSPSPRD